MTAIARIHSPVDAVARDPDEVCQSPAVRLGPGSVQGVRATGVVFEYSTSHLRLRAFSVRGGW